MIHSLCFSCWTASGKARGEWRQDRVLGVNTLPPSARSNSVRVPQRMRNDARGTHSNPHNYGSMLSTSGRRDRSLATKSRGYIPFPTTHARTRAQEFGGRAMPAGGNRQVTHVLPQTWSPWLPWLRVPSALQPPCPLATPDGLLRDTTAGPPAMSLELSTVSPMLRAQPTTAVSPGRPEHVRSWAWVLPHSAEAPTKTSASRGIAIMTQMLGLWRVLVGEVSVREWSCAPVFFLECSGDGPELDPPVDELFFSSGINQHTTCNVQQPAHQPQDLTGSLS